MAILIFASLLPLRLGTFYLNILETVCSYILQAVWNRDSVVLTGNMTKAGRSERGGQKSFSSLFFSCSFSFCFCLLVGIFLLLLCFVFFSDCLSPGANLCKNLGSFLCVCSVISGWEQVLSSYFKILEDRMIVKVQMFAEIRKNKLDFCLKCNQHPTNFKLQKQLNLCQWTARYPPPALVFMELSSSTYKMDTSSEKGKSGTMMWHQSKPSFFFFFLN